MERAEQEEMDAAEEEADVASMMATVDFLISYKS